MLPRRAFLRQSSLLALAPAVPAFVARTALAAEPERDGRILVVIQLDGGNDGINTVVPFKDEGYAKHRKTLLELLSTYHLPAICEMRMYVIEGCLMTYGASFDAMFRRAAYYVDRILKGAKPADLPVEQPREFELVINRTTAQALGLTLSPLLLYQATEVVQ